MMTSMVIQAFEASNYVHDWLSNPVKKRLPNIGLLLFEDVIGAWALSNSAPKRVFQNT